MLKAKKKQRADWDSSKAERTFRKRNGIKRIEPQVEADIDNDPETLDEIDAQNEALMDDYYQYKYPETDV